jgi:ribosomal protein S2
MEDVPRYKKRPGDIDKADYFVPCNVNSIKALAFILGEIKSSIKARRSTEDRRPLGNKTEKLPLKSPKDPNTDTEKTSE